MNDIDKLLDKKNLSRTPCRVEILKILFDAKTALSEPEIREKMAYAYDRTTVYRTLRSFINEGVIHSILVEGMDVRYAITEKEISSVSPYHVHFSCNNCRNVYCISTRNFETPKIPESYITMSYDLMIHGICERCVV